MAEANWKWFINLDNGLPYGTEGDGEPGETQIANPPIPYQDYQYVGSPLAWVAKTQEVFDAEENAFIDEEFDNDRRMKAIVKWIATLHGLSNTEAKDQLRAIYKALP